MAPTPRTGEFPESLEQLHEVIPWELREDPFSGEDFIYRREGDGYLIYSIGPDLQDDGGAPFNYQERINGIPTGDLLWRTLP